MRMNSMTGKQILALARGGDYAHPGEEEAIELVMAHVAKRPDQVVLDVGCGCGGTAHYLADHGWGVVTGVDIDAENIASARAAYPMQAFVCADAGDLTTAWHGRADLICLFTAFYAFPDQARALAQMRAVAADDATLVMFDYTCPAFDARVETLRAKRTGSWQPLRLDRAPAMLADAGWRVETMVDLTPQFDRWYGDLVRRIVSAEHAIVEHAGRPWFEFAAAWYRELADAVHEGVVGGATISARAAPSPRRRTL
jgi:SAM-dependent methyltransferase